VPVRTTTPPCTTAVTLPGSPCKRSSSSSRTSAASSMSGRRKTLSRSRRLMMPSSFPSGSTTGRRRRWRAFISRAAPGIVASGWIVIAGDVISSPAVSPQCRGRWPGQRCRPAAPMRARRASSSSTASRSASETTPATCRPIMRTGIPLIRCWASRWAISLYGVIRSTVTTEVVITSRTRRVRRPGRCRSPAGCSRRTPAGATEPAGRRFSCSASWSSTALSARVTSAWLALPCRDS
jgi:hypothetical protein